MTNLNGENLASAAFLLFSVILISTDQVIAVPRKLYAACYILVAVRIGLVMLGQRTSRNDGKALKHYEHYCESWRLLAK